MASYGKATISHTFILIATVIAGEIGTEKSRECFVVKKTFAGLADTTLAEMHELI